MKNNKDLIALREYIIKFYNKYKSDSLLYETKVLQAIIGLSYTINKALGETDKYF